MLIIFFPIRAIKSVRINSYINVMVLTLTNSNIQQIERAPIFIFLLTAGQIFH